MVHEVLHYLEPVAEQWLFILYPTSRQPRQPQGACAHQLRQVRGKDLQKR